MSPDMETTILVIDDDARLQELLARYLGGYGCRTIPLEEGSNALEILATKKPDIVVLDLMLPGPDGFDVLRAIRGVSAIPVIMLTAKGEEEDRIVGLELGADDYLAKPFNPRELLARVRAVLRRAGAPGSGAARETVPSGLIASEGLALDAARRLLSVEEDAAELTQAETNLMAVFMRNPDAVLSRDELMTRAFGREYQAFDRTIDVHVARLRAILKRHPRQAGRISTVWGAGYLFLGKP